MIDIRLSVVGANKTEVHLGDNMLFFSYDTLVGVFGPLVKVANGHRSTRYFVTSKKFSKTTSRHITEWLGWYWAGGHPGLNRKDDKYGGPDVPNAPYLASHLRIELAEAEKIVADVLAGNMTKEQFTGMVVRMQPRWYQEARAVIEWMLAGRSE